jgi:tRNA A-37 threonylcarbamoyl transferase component Bud32
MKTEKIANRCPRCQAPLPDDAPQGLCAKCLLAAVSTPTEAGQPPGERPPPPFETVTAAFPQLEIVEVIGHGGMGVVYKARQPRLDRFVALKILPQSLAADAAFAERFHREARVLARLNHPNIVTVHDFGQSGGFFYLLMEFVDGVNLRQAMQAGRFSPQQALFLVPKICEALQFAHEEGILHRDIKPENILLDGRGRVKIADFGIAKLVGEAKENITLTASGLAVGTPHYMAPEQLEHPQDVDQRADIYSLGVVFYEMLTGELPIGRFAPPSQKSPVDPRVDEIVLHALEKEREKRYRSAGEVKTSVENITSHPAASPDAQPGPMAPAPVRRTDCYFSTPRRMRHCFPGPQAHIYQCKGELLLEAQHLTFVSPWPAPITIPLKDIRDLSIGQFQMWTTPWVMKYSRVNFVSVTYDMNGAQRTVCLTPVKPGTGSTAEINAQVADWFEAVRKAVLAVTGANPRSAEPGRITIGAQRSWNLKGVPLMFAPVMAWLVGILNMRSAEGLTHIPLWAATVFPLLILLPVMALLWFSFGFLKANHALKVGNLDAVTCDEPPGDAVPGRGEAFALQARSPSSAARRPFWWTVSAWIFIAIGLLAVIDGLSGLYARPMNPSFSPALAHLFAGVALLSLSRSWRRVALVGLAIALVAGALIVVMTVVSPEHGSINLPAFNVTIPATEKPRWAAAGAVFLGLGLGWPCYLLLSAKAKALFGLVKTK